MSKYNALCSAIEANFSAEAGADPEMLEHFKRRLHDNSAWRESMLSQLEESLSDQGFSWKAFLWSDYCHVIDADSEDEARRFLVENLLQPILAIEQGKDI